MIGHTELPWIKNQDIYDPKLLYGFAWSVRIAVLDSGVTSMSDRISGVIDFTGTGTTCIFEHGDIVTDIVHRYARGAQIFHLKIGNEAPDEMAMMSAIEWSIENKISVINISSEFIVTREEPCDLCKLVNIARENGIAVVVAAGNNGEKKKPKVYIACPGMAIGAVTVGALNCDGGIASFSSRSGKKAGKPNLLAPGFFSYKGTPVCGTSFAAPLVSGVIASTLRKTGNIETALQLLYSTTDQITNEAPSEQGCGFVNVKKLCEVIRSEKTVGYGKR